MSTCTGFIAPLDLECYFVNMFAGTGFIFTSIAFIVIMAAGASFRMSTANGLIMAALFALMFATFMPGIYLITILVLGLMAFSLTKRVVSTQ